jgi:MFS family permease
MGERLDLGDLVTSILSGAILGIPIGLLAGMIAQILERKNAIYYAVAGFGAVSALASVGFYRALTRSGSRISENEDSKTDDDMANMTYPY